MNAKYPIISAIFVALLFDASKQNYQCKDMEGIFKFCVLFHALYLNSAFLSA